VRFGGRGRRGRREGGFDVGGGIAVFGEEGNVIADGHVRRVVGFLCAGSNTAMKINATVATHEDATEDAIVLGLDVNLGLVGLDGEQDVAGRE
jgi:hypothetical protein